MRLRWSGSERRGPCAAATEEALRKQREQQMSIESETDGYKRNIKEVRLFAVQLLGSGALSPTNEAKILTPSGIDHNSDLCFLSPNLAETRN